MQKKRLLSQLLLFVLFLSAGGLISACLQYELSYDFLLYHHYNGFAFINDRLTTDVAPASVATYYNPLLDAVLYLLNDYFKNNTAAYCFVTGLPFGAMMFVLFKISLLFFDFKTLKGKCCCFACLMIAATGVSTWFQIGTSTHEITIAVFILAALYLLLKNPEQNKSHLIAGLLLGASAGLKLTAAIYCVSTGLTLILLYGALKKPKAFIGLLMLGGLAGYVITNGFWAFILWQNFKNPVFPFWNKIFQSPYYPDINYVDTLHLKDVSWKELLFLPFSLILHPLYSNIGAFQELTDFRLSFLFLIAVGYIFLFKKFPLSFLMKQTVLWLFVSYVVWLLSSANLRFIVPVETISALIFVSVFSLIKRPTGVLKEALYYSAAFILLFVFVSTVSLSEPWGNRNQGELIKENVVLPQNTALEVFRFPLSAIAAEIARQNPTLKIVSIVPDSPEWEDWNMAKAQKMNEKKQLLLKNSAKRAALFQDGFGLVLNEHPELKNWFCRPLEISASLKSILFSNVMLCLKPYSRQDVSP